MSAVEVVIPWDGQNYTVSASTMAVIDRCVASNAGAFTAQVAREVNDKLVERAKKAKKGLTPLYTAQKELYIYALFVGDLHASEMTWLAQVLGGNGVRYICVAAAKRRQRRLNAA